MDSRIIRQDSVRARSIHLSSLLRTIAYIVLALATNVLLWHVVASAAAAVLIFGIWVVLMMYAWNNRWW
jgi:hypothetical protein